MVARECPYCGADSGQINNHIRMSSGDGHGETGTYPEDWDKKHHERAGDREIEPETELDENEPAPRSSGFELDQEPDPEEPEQTKEPETLQFGDSMDDKREYECGNCGESIPYLGGDDREEGGKECPNCGDRLFWSMMDS